jgi:hypothetical protein
MLAERTHARPKTTVSDARKMSEREDMKYLTLLSLTAILAGCSCDSSSPTGGADGSTSPGLDGSQPSADGATLADGASALDAPATGVTQCSNGRDDDGDGKIDGSDPECSGPADNDESSFGTGIPGDNRDADCQDCFFDGNSGAGDDHCAYATSCLTTGQPTSGNGMCATCEASEQCLRAGGCRDATPNGCDCYGCCSVQVSPTESVNVLLSSTCSLSNIDDTAACQRCVQATDCVNTCDRCELCLGRTPADLPADCTATSDGGVAYTCSGGTACSTDDECAALGGYCSLGCCLVILQ